MPMFSSRACGIDISDRSIEAVELERHGDVFRLIAESRNEIPSGLVEDGIIADQEALSRAIADTLAHPAVGKFTTQRTVCMLPESRILRWHFSFPEQLNAEQIRKALPAEAEKVMPFDVGGAAWDLTIVGTKRGKQQVQYAVIPHKLLAQYGTTFSEAKIDVIALEPESDALVRSLAASYTETGLVTLLDIGARTTNVCICDALGIQFTLTVPIAGNHFTEAIASRMNIPTAEAEKKKQNSGLKLKPIQAVLSPLLKRIIAEADKAVTYVERKTGSRLKQLMLCGGSSLVPGVTEYVRGEVSCEVSIGDPWKNVSSTTGIPPEKGVLYATAIGLAMRGADEKSYKGSSINFLHHNT